MTSHVVRAYRAKVRDDIKDERTNVRRDEPKVGKVSAAQVSLIVRRENRRSAAVQGSDHLVERHSQQRARQQVRSLCCDCVG